MKIPLTKKKTRSGNASTPAAAAATPLSPTTLFPNPGLVAPGDAAWLASRKPLAALWGTVDGAGRVWTVNVHLASKGGSTSLAGDARPPVNGGVEQRAAQAGLVAQFVAEVEGVDAGAKVVVAGDFNEFAWVGALEGLMEGSGLRDLDEVVGVAGAERYTYVYDGGAQALDHGLVSAAVAEGVVGWEHVHVNTWGEGASDHDPSVGRVDVCV